MFRSCRVHVVLYVALAATLCRYAVAWQSEVTSYTPTHPKKELRKPEDLAVRNDVKT